MGISRAALALCMLAAACLPGRAAAWMETHAEVVCHRDMNVALVRFAIAEDGQAPVFRELPPEVDAMLSTAPPSGLSDCSMANGWQIRMRSGDEQAFAYGAGGANPPAFFSLWIERRKVISRQQWKPGYGSDTDPWIVALVIRPDRLTTCRLANGWPGQAKGEAVCTDERLQLDRHAIDAVEYAKPGSLPALGSITVLPGSSAPRLCRQYAAAQGPDWPSSISLSEAEIEEADAVPRFTTKSGYTVTERIVELAPGVQRKLIDLYDDRHYFDGDWLFIAPVSADARTNLDLEALVGSSEPARNLPAGWQLVSGGQPTLYPDVSPRYVHLYSQTIDGHLFLLAYPTNRN